MYVNYCEKIQYMPTVSNNLIRVISSLISCNIYGFYVLRTTKPYFTVLTHNLKLLSTTAGASQPAPN